MVVVVVVFDVKQNQLRPQLKTVQLRQQLNYTPSQTDIYKSV